MLNTIDEYSREWLALRMSRKLNSDNVFNALSDLFILRDIPSFIRSDLPIEGSIGSRPMGDGPELVAQALQDWIKAVGAKKGLHRARITQGERLL